MRQSSPQLVISAIVSVLAMAVVAIGSPAIGQRADGASVSVPAVAGIEAPALPAFPALFLR